MSVVLNPATTTEAFNQSMEDVGMKPLSDGITIDHDGRVLITDVEHGSIMALNPATLKLSKLGGSKDIVWPDGIVVGTGGDVYFTDSSIPSYLDQLVRAPTKTKLMEHRPYFIYRLRKSNE
jgi:streptogramin lyase